MADADRVVVLGVESGTIRRTGETSGARFAHVLTVENGRITQLDGYVDTVLIVRAFES